MLPSALDTALVTHLTRSLAAGAAVNLNFNCLKLKLKFVFVFRQPLSAVTSLRLFVVIPKTALTTLFQNSTFSPQPIGFVFHFIFILFYFRINAENII